jgi:hypothetical protein
MDILDDYTVYELDKDMAYLTSYFQQHNLNEHGSGHKCILFYYHIHHTEGPSVTSEPQS